MRPAAPRGYATSHRTTVPSRSVRTPPTGSRPDDSPTPAPSGHLFPRPPGVGLHRRDPERHGQGRVRPLRRRPADRAHLRPGALPQAAGPGAGGHRGRAGRGAAHHRRPASCARRWRTAAGGWTCPGSRRWTRWSAPCHAIWARPSRPGWARSTRWTPTISTASDALDYAIGPRRRPGPASDLESADVVLVGVSRTSKTPDLHLSGPPRRAGGQCAAGARAGGRRSGCSG